MLIYLSYCLLYLSPLSLLQSFNSTQFVCYFELPLQKLKKFVLLFRLPIRNVSLHHAVAKEALNRIASLPTGFVRDVGILNVLV